MGVDYSAYVAYGFPAPPVPEDKYDYEWWEETTPPGFSFVAGGDFMSGINTRAIYGLSRHLKRVMDSNSQGFGVFKTDDFIEVTEAERDMVISAARELGVDEREIGYYVVSSVD